MNENTISQRLEKVNLSNVYAADYQREANNRQVNAIVSGFDEAKLGVIVVSERDGRFYVIDGNHRVSALKHLGVAHAIAIVLEDMTYEMEADYFRRQNENHRPLSLYARFKAGVEAKDPLHVRISDIARNHGFEIGRPIKSFDRLSAINALYVVVNNYGYEILDESLRRIRATWDGIEQSTTRDAIVGTADFVKCFPKVSVEMFTEKLIDKGYGKLWQEYLMATSGKYMRKFGDPFVRKAFCRAIVNCYNAGLHHSKRLKMED